MSNLQIGLLTAAVSLLVSFIFYPWVLKFARLHNIVDNPNARKLQRRPVPVMGGVVVYFGILAGGLVLSCFHWNLVLVYGLIGMTVMLCLGVWDDLCDISPLLRLIIEIALVGGYIAFTGIYIDHFHGLWGINELDPVFAIPFSIFVGVGVINATNLIDGVDGYCSGYGMLACACFGLAFFNVWSTVMVCMSMIVIGAILPFFMHNVFGYRTKMFFGDGGTLMLGMMMVVFIFYALSSQTEFDAFDEMGISLTAFVFAVGCIPVFDTLRVMIIRILRGKSPFHPDRTHLHHLFIDMDFSHLAASLSILIMNGIIVCIWLLSWYLGASVSLQTDIVIVLGILSTFVFYRFMRIQQSGGVLDEEGYPTGSRLWHRICAFGLWTHRDKKRSWRVTRYYIDKY